MIEFPWKKKDVNLSSYSYKEHTRSSLCSCGNQILLSYQIVVNFRIIQSQHFLLDGCYLTQQVRVKPLSIIKKTSTRNRNERGKTHDVFSDRTTLGQTVDTTTEIIGTMKMKLVFNSCTNNITGSLSHPDGRRQGKFRMVWCNNFLMPKPLHSNAYVFELFVSSRNNSGLLLRGNLHGTKHRLPQSCLTLTIFFYFHVYSCWKAFGWILTSPMNPIEFSAHCIRLPMAELYLTRFI